MTCTVDNFWEILNLYLEQEKNTSSRFVLLYKCYAMLMSVWILRVSSHSLEIQHHSEYVLTLLRSVLWG